MLDADGRPARRYLTDVAGSMQLCVGHQYLHRHTNKPDSELGDLRINRVVLVTQFDRICLLYTSPSPRDLSTSRMPSSA